MLVTSALASKLIKQYNDEIIHLSFVERNAISYQEVIGNPVEIPDYSFLETQEAIEKLNSKVLKLKHAINKFNTTTRLNDGGLTIDQALVRMEQLSGLKQKYQQMRDMPEKRLNRSFSSVVTEYTCRNFDVDEVNVKYNSVVKELQQIQISLDLCNNTKTFDVDIED